MTCCPAAASPLPRNPKPTPYPDLPSPGGPQPLLRRYLGRRAWPFPTEASHVAGLAAAVRSTTESRMERGMERGMERRAVVLIARKGQRAFVPGVEIDAEARSVRIVRRVMPNNPSSL